MAMCRDMRLGRVFSRVGSWLVVVVGVAALACPAAAGAVAPRGGPFAAGLVPGYPALGSGGGTLGAPVGERAAAAASLRAWRALPAPARAAVSRTLGRDQAAYRAVATAGGFRLVNRRGGLVARFDRRGARVVAGRARAGLALRAVGYGTALRTVAGVVPRARANRVVYRRGGVSEWFVNGPAGLEHGFTLAGRPGGARRGALTLSLALTGVSGARVDRDRRGVTLRAVHGEGSLRYAGLWASDARGRMLPARLRVAGARLLVSVDDRRARYPLTIDPFFEAAKLTAGDGARGDGLGWSVAVSGDTIVAGAPFDDIATNNDRGSAYVFVRPTGGTWATATQTKLTAGDGAAGDELG